MIPIVFSPPAFRFSGSSEAPVVIAAMVLCEVEADDVVSETVVVVSVAVFSEVVSDFVVVVSETEVVTVTVCVTVASVGVGALPFPPSEAAGAFPLSDG